MKIKLAMAICAALLLSQAALAQQEDHRGDDNPHQKNDDKEHRTIDNKQHRSDDNNQHRESDNNQSRSNDNGQYRSSDSNQQRSSDNNRYRTGDNSQYQRTSVMHDRGSHEGWYREGGVVPREYRDNSYVVSDWRSERLREPPHGYNWIRSDNGDFLLVAITTGVITGIMLSH